MDPLLANDLELAQKATPAEKLGQALEMMRVGIHLKCDALRHQYPNASAAEIASMLNAWLLQDG
jgi:hypothetical protein